MGRDDTAALEVAATPFQFEGVEKKLEIDFKLVRANGTRWAPFPPPESTRADGLRAVPREQWDAICALVSCQILSATSNAYFDSYVLSESSLFVYPQKLLLKTCGTTTLLACVEQVVKLAEEYDLHVESAYYSRQRFLFPERQPFPHTSFQDETARLNEFFRRGESYCLGELGSDHWYLYHADHAVDKPRELRLDRTTEVMMQELDEDVMRLFFIETYTSLGAVEAAIARAWLDDAALVADVRAAAQQAFAAGAAAGDDANAVARRAARAVVRRVLWLDELFPGVVVDDHVFEPCGYSVNGLFGATYMTMHVTPESTHSFVSFEANCVALPPKRLLCWLARRLRPGRLALALFADAGAGEGNESRRRTRLAIDGYAQRQSTHYEFFGAGASGAAPYDVMFVTFLLSSRFVKDSAIS